MSDFGPTQLSPTTKELWDTKVEEARYAEAVIVNRISNKSEIAKQKGDTINVSIDQKFTATVVGSDGTFTPQNYVLGNAILLLDQWYCVPIQVLDQAAAQSFWTPESTFPTNAGKAFGVKYDSDLAAYWSSVDAANIVGSTSSPTIFDAAKAREAVFKLVKKNVPLSTLSFILDPTAYYGGILTELQLTAANMAGLPKNVLTTGAMIPLLNVPTYISNNIVETGTPPVKKNLLVHKSSMAIAWSKTNTIDNVRSVANLTLAQLLVMQNVFGSKVIRSDHFAVINSEASGSF